MDKPIVNDSIKKTAPLRKAKLKDMTPASKKKAPSNATIAVKPLPASIGQKAKRASTDPKKPQTKPHRPGKFDDVQTTTMPNHAFLLEMLDGESLIRVQRLGDDTSLASGYSARISSEIPTAIGGILVVEDNRAMSGNQEFRLFTNQSNRIKVGYVNADKFIPLKKAAIIRENQWTFYNDDEREPRIIIEMSDNNTIATSVK